MPGRVGELCKDTSEHTADRVENRRRRRRTPQVQSGRHASGGTSPQGVVSWPHISDDAGGMGVGVDEGVCCLDDLLRHGGEVDGCGQQRRGEAVRGVDHVSTIDRPYMGTMADHNSQSQFITRATRCLFITDFIFSLALGTMVVCDIHASLVFLPLIITLARNINQLLYGEEAHPRRV